MTGTIVDSSAVTATINGQPLTLGSGGSLSATVNLVEGLNTITVSATDAATNNSTASRTVTRNTIEPGVPPDPSTVAPALDRTISTNPASSTQFLYSGATPIQTGVQANALQLAEKYGASDVRVFGSVARGEAHEGSDIDFVVRMAPDRSLFDLGGLLMDLQDLLGRRGCSDRA